MDISVPKPVKRLISPDGFTKKRTAWFLKRLGSLLKEGFSLKEALLFLQTLLPKAQEREYVQQLYDGLEAGYGLDEGLANLSFPPDIVSQVYFASLHGQYAEALYQCGLSLEEKEKRRKKLLALMAYPFLLIVFMTGLLLSMRSVLLPHLLVGPASSGEGTSVWEQTGRAASWFVHFFPFLLIGGVLLLGCIILLVSRYLHTIQPMQRAHFFSSWPFIGSFVRLYYTQLFMQEWGHLFVSGLQLHDIVSIMQHKNTTPLIHEMGYHLEEELNTGRSFPAILEELSFLKEETSRVVRHGETTSHLGKELRVYSEECLNEMEEGVEKAMAYIQPLSFLVIAFLIVSVYGALLLPMLSNMEGII